VADPAGLSIGFVVDRFGARYGGAEAYGVELMRELHAQGHRITVYAREYDPACGLGLPFVPIRIARHWPSWIRVWLFARRAARLVRGRHDIVHSHMNGWCGDVEVVHVTPVRSRWFDRDMARHKRWQAHISPRVRTYLRLETRRMQQRPGHRVVAVSRLIASQIERAYGLQGVPVIPPGVGVVGATRTLERKAVRAELGLPAEQTLCLLVARNPMRKGLPTVLQAMERLPDHIGLIVVGANAAARDCVARAPEGVRARVHLVAQTSRVAPYYRAADIYVHPTLNDSFGMAPLEAMAFGLPVILSPAPWCGFAQYLEHGQDALILPHPEQPQALADLVLQLQSDPQLVRRLHAGAQRVLARHAWPEVARQYLDLYAQVLHERGTGPAAWPA